VEGQPHTLLNAANKMEMRAILTSLPLSIALGFAIICYFSIGRNIIKNFCTFCYSNGSQTSEVKLGIFDEVGCSKHNMLHLQGNCFRSVFYAQQIPVEFAMLMQSLLVQGNSFRFCIQNC